MIDDIRLVSTDLAFRKHSATAVVLAARNRILHVLACDEWRPRPREPLIPSEVMANVIAMARAHEVEAIAGDVHYIDTALEHTRAEGLAWRTIDNSKKEDAYTNFRVLLRERRVHGLETETEPGAELVRQLRQTRAAFSKGGRMQIVPAKGGGHGDLVSALVGGAQILWPYLLAPPEPGIGDPYAVDASEPLDDDETEAEGDVLVSRWATVRTL